MRSIYKYFIFTLTALSLSGCKKYVDIKTQGSLVPDQTINYRYLLNNANSFEPVPSLSDYASSDININDASQITGLSSLFYGWFTAAYTWSPVIYAVGNPSYEQDVNWNSAYTKILACNTIINELPGSVGPEQDKVQMTAEALVHRADAYLVLINNYAKPYNASTASTDLGVPLLTVQTVTQSLNRATVQAVYDQIIADLTRAIPGLPSTQLYNNLPSLASAYGELARCYLYMNDYANASRYADQALALRSTLDDLSVLTSVTTTNYPRRIADPEILLSKLPFNGSVRYSPTALKMSDEFLALLGTTDQRYTLFSAPASTISSAYTGRYYSKEIAVGETRNEGPSVPEMLLIKAEASARTGDPANAMLWVNRLRVRRFRPANYVPMTATSASDALVKVIDERRREFFGLQLRWWDMRRLKDEAPFSKTYTRVYNGVTYTLAPNSNRYTFPIAQTLINLNTELEPNP
ncbi:SusD family protein [Pedobacter westerhofensis]|uniref:SusD family protein n=1 Tax=Pedobacter westerhofensis TaxID=425512 RepID=A0A521FU17_9SPHI|nr:RagB/SusD family nutrient uptake outer membrane protein [Pedobacter westerhofensis]SMO99031.1 SusD family protein [Pedobacter westerhofensis]